MPTGIPETVAGPRTRSSVALVCGLARERSAAVHLTVYGLNHRTAGVRLRERVAIGPDELADALSALRKYPNVRECMILSTCNRTEIYTISHGSRRCNHSPHAAVRFLVDFRKLDLSELEPSLYCFEKDEAVAHLFKVACGLDSMVIGENQILRQVRNAYSAACDAESNGHFLNRLAYATFRVGKEVRTRTALNEGSLSVSYAACDLASNVFTDLAKTKVLVIGAGETGELTARNMRKRGVSEMLVANRTKERAETLASKLKCAVLPMNRLQHGLSEADIVVSCTAGSEYVVTHSMVDDALSRRKNGLPLFLIDLAVPRDIDESAGELDKVHLYNIDDLQEIISTNGAKRQAERRKALLIVERCVKQFDRWRRTLAATPTICEMKDLFEQIRRDEQTRHAGQMTSKELTAADQMTKAVVKRITGLAIGNIKAASGEPGADTFLSAVRRLFDLRKEDISQPEAPSDPHQASLQCAETPAETSTC